MLAEEHMLDLDVIVDGLIQLGLTERQEHKTRELLARYLSGTDSALGAVKVADLLVRLDPAAPERRHARRVLLNSIIRCNDSSFLNGWRETPFARLAPTEEEKEESRQELLGLLDDPANAHAAAMLAADFSGLDPGHADPPAARTHDSACQDQRRDQQPWSDAACHRADLHGDDSGRQMPDARGSARAHDRPG